MGRGIDLILKNKYLLTIVGFVVLMLFFDRNDVYTQIKRKQELEALNKSKDHYRSEIRKTKKYLDNLQNNPDAIEKIARENYFMKRDNEDIFIIKPSNQQK